MGRTIPSFRIASVMEKENWGHFAKPLDKEDKKIFYDMFAISILYNSDSIYSAKVVMIHPIFIFVIIIHCYKQLMVMSQELDQAESKNGPV